MRFHPLNSSRYFSRLKRYTAKDLVKYYYYYDNDEEPQEFPIFVGRQKWTKKRECRLEIRCSVLVIVCDEISPRSAHIKFVSIGSYFPEVRLLKYLGL